MNRIFISREPSLTIQRALYKLLNFRKTGFILLILGLISISVNAQSITVKGTVRDAKGEALEGINVVVKNSTTGTSTNSTGQYTIAVNGANSILVFTSVSYEPNEVVVGSNTSIDVVLNPKTITSDEVVVVGYGTQSKRNVTGAISKADMSRSEN